MSKERIEKSLKRRTRAGDTLVEIALAIGILGFVISAVVVTMSATLSTAQYSLEDTMTRNEIDVQAEALRYIHNAYAAQRTLVSSAQEYNYVWEAIVNQAVEPSAIPELTNVDSCSAFYPAQADDSDPHNLYNSNAFIINTHRLATSYTTDPAETPNIVITSRGTSPSTSIFQPAALYPRILYGNDSINEDLSVENALAANNLYRAEGLWIQVACSDNFSNCNSSSPGDKPSYYDFYIRSCWESSNDHSTSTIGTIIRLHNPDIDFHLANQQSELRVNYYVSSSSTAIASASAWDYTTHSFDVANLPSETYRYNSDGWEFVGWCVNYSSTNPQSTCSDPNTVYYPTSIAADSRVVASTSRNNGVVNLVAIYKADYNVYFNQNVSGASTFPSSPQTGPCLTINTTLGMSECRVGVLPDIVPTHPRATFAYWASSDGTVYNDSNAYYTFRAGNLQLTLLAYWRDLYSITYYANGTSVSNLPSPNPLTSTSCSTVACSIKVGSTLPTRPGHVFLGWSTNASATVADSNYAPGNTTTIYGDTNLYAIWQTATNDEWAVMASWSSGCSDIDSHTYIYRNSTQLGHIYYSNKTGTFNGTSVALDSDHTSPGYTETTTLNNLTASGNTAYVCMHCFSGSTNFAGGNLRVVVTSPELNFYRTYTSSSSASSSYWAVVKIQGSSVYFRNSLSCSPGW